MSLTWGRRHWPGPRRSTGRWIVLVLGVLAVAIVAAAKDTFVAQETSPIGPDTHGTIQGLFDLHRAAIERRDRVSYELTLDPRSPKFVACMLGLFDLGRERAEALAPGRVVGLEHVPNTNLVRVRLQQRDGIAVHYVRRFLIGPVTAFPALDRMRSVPAWYVSYPDPGDLAGPSPIGAVEGSGCGRDGPSR
ncbi:MAG: hypothetical protein HYY42_06220 [Chloroflexi bacterium]|nr:hypothetical protein [Chloroflexota bacterium]